MLVHRGHCHRLPAAPVTLLSNPANARNTQQEFILYLFDTNTNTGSAYMITDCICVSLCLFPPQSPSRPPPQVSCPLFISTFPSFPQSLIYPSFILSLSASLQNKSESRMSALKRERNECGLAVYFHLLCALGSQSGSIFHGLSCALCCAVFVTV